MDDVTKIENSFCSLRVLPIASGVTIAKFLS